MADVKWIKITTDVFDDEKILLIESLPEADSIIVIWFKLLCLAGKQNNSGVFLMGDKIAYTDKMLATIFRRKETTVQLALQTFEQFGMIELIDGVITIPNWGKHQSLEQLEARKKYQRDYQREYRKKQKLLTASEESKHLHKHLREDDVNSLDKIREDKKKIEEDNNILSDSNEPESCPEFHKKELYEGYVLLTPEEFAELASHPDYKKYIKKAVDYIRQHGEINGSHYKFIKKLMKETKHKYGEYKNVLLTDEELQKLKTEYSDYEERIERLSSYVASTGKAYKSHYATIRNWARKDAEKPGRKEMVPSWMQKKPGFNDFKQNTYDFEELENDILANNPVNDDPELKARVDALKERIKKDG